MKTNKHEGAVRQFIITSEAWYGKVLPKGDHSDEITVGAYYADGRMLGEFGIRWREIGGEATARLEAYEDSWSALWDFNDVIEAMAKLNGSSPTVAQVAAVLIACGVKDATDRISPYNRDPRFLASAEKAAELYRASFAAFLPLRTLARKLGAVPNWAENAEFGAEATPLPNVDHGLVAHAIALAKTLVVRRADAARAFHLLGKPEIAFEYRDVLDVPAQFAALRGHE